MQRDRLFVTGMVDACVRIVHLTDGRDVTELERTPTEREALLWNFTVPGEAANQVSDDLRAAHPDVPWRHATSLRNRIVHGYWAIELDVLVSTARQVVPDMLERLRRAFAALDR
ncbi:HepT-like ribonuclease domain-containing protein [Cellulomonas pakistanensis]|uniref:DUF86 domain-containing protein n=1 Tax=Cellulomonas pakistanensis TaxID=992287 RepID=A0A919P858_9CELL|nr:HepT-like ribonuclease domain-containing protein [Cellulomonas pakistanensis]GIG36120.1 hypothetical protein Cpa01nite_15010 [Cellulomonas pakistanensis]